MKHKIALCAPLLCGMLVLTILSAQPEQAKADGFFLSTKGFSLGISTRPTPAPGPVVYDVAPPHYTPVGPPPHVRVAPPPPRHYPTFDPYSRRPAYSPRLYPGDQRYGGLTPMPGPRPGGPMGPGGPRPGGPRF